jgi:flagellar motility protein MotE (MotC chaperone)
MRNGYQQFFKKAQDIKRSDESPAPRRSSAAGSRRPAGKGGASADEIEKRLRQAVRVRQRSKPPFPWKAAVGLAVSLGVAGFYLVAPETFERLGEHVEIRAMGNAAAESAKAAPAAEKSSPAANGEEKAAGGASTPGPDQSTAAKGDVPDDFSHFEKLKERKEQLDAREKELSELEEELQRQKVELDKRITQLAGIRDQIAQILKDRVEVDQEKVGKLVDLYSNMKPKQAADVIASINEDLAVEILAKMKKKNAAEIMNLLPPDKARALSEKYTGYRQNHPATKG